MLKVSSTSSGSTHNIASVAVTAPLVPLSDHHLLVRTTNASPFDSYTAAFFLCNALVSAVAQLRHPDVIEALQRRDTLWEAFEADLDEGMCRD